MGLQDIRKRETVDLEARAGAIRDDLIPELEGYIEDGHEEHSESELEDLRDRLDNQADACDRVVEALDGGEFVLQELLTAETSKLTDDVAEQAIDIDLDRQEASSTPKQGFHKVRTLQLSIVAWPDGVDPGDTEDDRDIGREVFCVGNLPDPVSDYLYECAVALNDVGEIEGVQNLSDFGV